MTSEGKKILIIGGGSGMGRAIAHKLAKEKAIVSKNNKIVTVGTRNLRDGLWDIIVSRASFLKPTPSNNSQQVNAVISLQQTKKELLDYLQASLFSPVKSTVLQAISNNNLFTFPGLDNIQLVRKYL